MLFRIELCTVIAEPLPTPWLTNQGESVDEVSYHDAFKVTLGIQAEDILSAMSIAVTAMSHAEDTHGWNLGGVVLEAHALPVHETKYRGSEKYFLQSMNLPGIFYVSGITYISVSPQEAAPVLERLIEQKDHMRRNGKPSTSFKFKPAQPEPTRLCRLVCPICGHWMQIDSLGFLYSFMEGLNAEDSEFQIGRESLKLTRPFLARHLSCSVTAEGALQNQPLRFVYEDDADYSALDPSKRE